MEHCTVETLLTRKKPCGQAAVVKYSNCEQPRGSQQALPKLKEAGQNAGAFLCKECDVAARDYEKRMRYTKEKAVAKSVMAPPKPAAKPAMAKEPPREQSGEIAFTAATKAPPQKPPAAAPAAKKPEPPREDSGMIEYTPAKKPDDKK